MGDGFDHLLNYLSLALERLFFSLSSRSRAFVGRVALILVALITFVVLAIFSI